MHLWQTPMFVLLIGSCVDNPPKTFQQPKVCALALRCYFGEGEGATTLRGIPEFAGFFADDTLAVDIYGVDGRCWYGDRALATSCTDRCKGLLWQDCAVPYTDIVPFCPDACASENALPCRLDDFASDGGPLFGSCPDEATCNQGSGCCDLPGHEPEPIVVDDCATNPVDNP